MTTADYLSEENIKWRTSKISDEYLPKDFPVPQDKSEVAWKKIEVISGQAGIKNIFDKSHFLKFETEVIEPAEILINTAYFPGWKLWVDGKLTSPSLDSGKIKLSLPAGLHQVIFKFVNTPIRHLANLISFLSLGVLIYFFRKSVKK
jgi:hypothetical protein